MSKYVKDLLQTEFERKFEDVNEFLVINTIGIDGNTNNDLRGELLEKGIRLTVVRNSIFKRAMKNRGFESIDSLLDGACTLAYGGDSIVDVAKEIAGRVKKIKPLEIKSAFVDGECLGTEAAKGLSDMPNRAELQGTISMLAQSPGRQVAGAIAGPAGIVAGCIKAIADKAEEGEKEAA